MITLSNSLDLSNVNSLRSFLTASVLLYSLNLSNVNRLSFLDDLFSLLTCLFSMCPHKTNFNNVDNVERVICDKTLLREVKKYQFRKISSYGRQNRTIENTDSGITAQQREIGRSFQKIKWDYYLMGGDGGKSSFYARITKLC